MSGNKESDWLPAIVEENIAAATGMGELLATWRTGLADAEKRGDEGYIAGWKDCMQGRIKDLAALAAQPAPVEQPRPMETAPKDGMIVRLLVRFTENGFEDAGPEKAVWTIGQNGADHHPEDDEWLFAGWNWEQDCFTQGVGEPIGWLPMIATPAQPAPVLGEFVVVGGRSYHGRETKEIEALPGHSLPADGSILTVTGRRNDG